MRRFILAALLIITSFYTFAQKNAVPRPKLAVGIVVDQMRWDYLYRYYDRYTSGGFKRLIKDGFSCQNAMIPYLPSFTAPGHTCVYTGSVPAIHGIAANDWIDNSTGRAWYCTEDTTVKPIGGSVKAGQMSPRNLLATTITDELRLATNMKSRVFGISLKDRGSILPAGHLANGAFWYDDSTGNFFTSTYYMQQLPAWLQHFNNKHLPDSMLKAGWQLLYPQNTYTQSLPDNNRFEGMYKGETAPVFPHKTEAAIGKDYGALRRIPAGLDITLQLARACVNGEQLGQQGGTDFLCISLSSTDYAGHQYGPNAMEMEDMYLRLDQELASFLRFLDSRIGVDNYVVFLTADHGAAHNNEYLKSINVPAGSSDESGMKAKLNAALKKEFGTDMLVRSLENYQVTFNEKQLAGNLKREAVKEFTCKWLKTQPEVAFAVDMDNLSDAAVPEPLRSMIINGYNRQRSGCIQIVLQPGWYSGHGATGTTHGTWNPYDTHIPMLWYGWHIPNGETYREVHMTDISATMAALLHIQMPSGCVGQVITEIMQ